VRNGLDVYDDKNSHLSPYTLRFFSHKTSAQNLELKLIPERGATLHAGFVSGLLL
jgi:hypothetical protein